jgi:hypothetical protein
MAITRRRSADPELPAVSHSGSPMVGSGPLARVHDVGGINKGDDVGERLRADQFGYLRIAARGA